MKGRYDRKGNQTDTMSKLPPALLFCQVSVTCTSSHNEFPQMQLGTFQVELFVLLQNSQLKQMTQNLLTWFIFYTNQEFVLIPLVSQQEYRETSQEPEEAAEPAPEDVEKQVEEVEDKEPLVDTQEEPEPKEEEEEVPPTTAEETGDLLVTDFKTVFGSPWWGQGWGFDYFF